MLTVQSFDNFVFDCDKNQIREVCTDCGQAKIVASDGHAVCPCTPPVQLPSETSVDDRVVFVDKNGEPWTINDILMREG